MPDARLPCTCSATCQPCHACLAWGERPWRTRRPQRVDREGAERRLRGLVQAHQPGATTPLVVPLAPLEVAWL